MTPRVPRSALVLGAVGIVSFSFTIPATRLAVADLDPWFVAFGRSVAAGLLGSAFLLATRARRPNARQWKAIGFVALGVVIGFPLLTSLALQTRPAGQAAVTVAVLPAATAVMAVLRAGERPSVAFWVASVAGMVIALAFAVTRGAAGLAPADLQLAGAVVLCALGYAEGGVLSRELGGAQVICWALVAALPLSVVIAALSIPTGHVGTDAWACFAYVSIISMFLGFFAWYAGLARGGVARVGQLQLAQPVLTMGWAALVLGEAIGVAELGTAMLVLTCVVATQRVR